MCFRCDKNIQQVRGSCDNSKASPAGAGARLFSGERMMKLENPKKNHGKFMGNDEQLWRIIEFQLLMGKSSVDGGIFQQAMFDYQRVQ